MKKKIMHIILKLLSKNNIYKNQNKKSKHILIMNQFRIKKIQIYKLQLINYNKRKQDLFYNHNQIKYIFINIILDQYKRLI